MILNFDFDFLVELHLDDVIQVLLRNSYINTKGIFTEKKYDVGFIYLYTKNTRLRLPSPDHPNSFL